MNSMSIFGVARDRAGFHPTAHPAPAAVWAFAAAALPLARRAATDTSVNRGFI